jgi:hypothetical protein
MGKTSDLSGIPTRITDCILSQTKLSMEENMLHKKWALLGALVVISTLVLAACQPQTVIVEKEVKVTEIVEVEKEVTKIVAGTPVVETIVETQVVEREVVVTATPVPSEKPVTLNMNLGAEPPQVDPALSTDTTSWTSSSSWA